MTPLPEVNTLVRIALGEDLPVLPSRVEDVVEAGSGAELVVAAPSYVGDVQGPQLDGLVSVHWTGARGVCSAPARFLGVGRQEGCAVKVWRLRVVDEVTLVQRRRYARVETGAAVSVSAADVDTVRVGWVLDLSEGGVRCRIAPGAFTVDEPVEVRINLDGEVVTAVGSVLRAERREGAFDEIIVTFPEDHPAARLVRRHVLAEQARQRRLALADRS